MFTKWKSTEKVFYSEEVWLDWTGRLLIEIRLQTLSEGGSELWGESDLGQQFSQIICCVIFYIPGQNKQPIYTTLEYSHEYINFKIFSGKFHQIARKKAEENQPFILLPTAHTAVYSHD